MTTEQELRWNLGSGSVRKGIGAEIKAFCLADGVVVSGLIAEAWEKDVISVQQGAYPIEAYVQECVGYIEDLAPAHRRAALGHLGQSSKTVERLCRVALGIDGRAALESLGRRVSQVDMGHKYPVKNYLHTYRLAFELWKAQGGGIEELISGDFAWGLDSLEALYPLGLNQAECAVLRTRLSEDIHYLGSSDLWGEEVLVQCREEPACGLFEQIFQSDSSWARGIVERLIALGTVAPREVLNLAARFRVTLSLEGAVAFVDAMREDKQERLTEVVAHARKCFSIAEDAELLATTLWQGRGYEVFSSIIAFYLPLSKVGEVLAKYPNKNIATSLARRQDIGQRPDVARECWRISPDCLSYLFGHVGAELQQEIAYGDHNQRLADIIRTAPQTIKEGVRVPASVIAKALSQGTGAEKQRLMGHLGRLRGEEDSSGANQLVISYAGEH